MLTVRIVRSQAAAAAAETHDVRARTVAAGVHCGTAYKLLLEQVNIVSITPASKCLFTHQQTLVSIVIYRLGSYIYILSFNTNLGHVIRQALLRFFERFFIKVHIKMKT